MGDYATYQGQQIKTGSCGEEFNLRAAHVPQLTADSTGDVRFTAPRGNGVIADGLWYRFPWPDEDDQAPGSYWPEFPTFRVVAIPARISDENCACGGSSFGIVQHRAMNGHLALETECMTCHGRFRLENEHDAAGVIAACRRVAGQPGDFWDTVADRIEAGYRDPLPWAAPGPEQTATQLAMSGPIGQTDTAPQTSPADRIAAEFPNADGDELDDWVIDYFSKGASDLNNRGIAAQIAYLLDQGEAEDDIRARLQVEAEAADPDAAGR